MLDSEKTIWMDTGYDIFMDPVKMLKTRCSERVLRSQEGRTIKGRLSNFRTPDLCMYFQGVMKARS